MKIAAWRRSLGDKVTAVLRLGRQVEDIIRADEAWVTSHFSWEAQDVMRTIKLMKDANPTLFVRLGGIYPTVAPLHASTNSGADAVTATTIDEADRFKPDYALFGEGYGKDGGGMGHAYVWTTRGCIRSCSFCIVPRAYGRNKRYPLPVAEQIEPNHITAYVMDDNTLSGPDPVEALLELKATGLRVNFSQGLDARLITREIASLLRGLKMPFVRVAFDQIADAPAVSRGIENLKRYGPGHTPVSMCLYNHDDGPEQFFARVKFLLTHQVSACLKRYNPLDAAEKNKYVSPTWRPVDVRAVEGFCYKYGNGGSLRPSNTLTEEFQRARAFADVFHPEEVYCEPAG